MKITKKYQFILFDLLALNLAYWGMHFLSPAVGLSASYYKLWLLIHAVWGIVHFSRKNHWALDKGAFKARLFHQVTSSLYMLYLTVLIVIFLGSTDFSLYHIFGTFISYWLISIVPVSLYKNNAYALPDHSYPQKKTGEVRYLLFDTFLLMIGFFVIYFIKYSSLSLDPKGIQVLLFLTGINAVTSQWTRQYHDIHKFYHAVAGTLRFRFFISRAFFRPHLLHSSCFIIPDPLFLAHCCF
ncbi:MAG: hypothetical protein U5R06_04115 [candidate division KSB1 bacterium]|nr:hypothetical protein [candidate division KSB1 bacterium]